MDATGRFAADAVLAGGAYVPVLFAGMYVPLWRRHRKVGHLPGARLNAEGRIHHDRRRLDVCATRR